MNTGAQLTLTDKVVLDLELMLAKHDWYYDFADDQKSWIKGRRQWTDIEAALKLVPENVGRDLVQRFCPLERRGFYGIT